MPFQFFVVSMTDTGEDSSVLNGFLSSHRVISVDRRWLDQGTNSCWAFCVEYVLNGQVRETQEKHGLNRNRIDYKSILSPEEFVVFSQLRQLRKDLAQLEAVPVYALFNNEQLAQMVQRRCATKSDFLKIEGIGEVKVDKYLDRLMKVLSNLLKSDAESTVS